MIGNRWWLLAIVTLIAEVKIIAAVTEVFIEENIIPTGQVLDEGTTFYLRWEGNVDASDSKGILQLAIKNGTDTPEYAATEVIEDNLDLSKMSYDWLAQQPLGYANPAELDFSLRIVYSDGKKSTSTNWFHVWTVWGYNDPPRTSSVTSGSGTILSSVKSDASQSQSETYTSTPSTHFRTETATLAGFAGQTRDSGHQSPSAGNNKSDDNDDTTGPGLSRGAIAGIVVGVLAGLGIFAGLVSLVLYYRRKSLGSANARRGEGADGHENDPNGDDGDVAGVSGLRSSYRKAELEAHDQEIKEIDENIKDVGHEHIEAGTEARVVEANSGQKAIYELQGDDFVQEADARPLPRELDSNARAELDAVGDFKERADSPR